MRFIGIDPGGRNSFGWAVLHIGESGAPASLRTGLCSLAGAALNQASEAAASAPAAVGIDAPLFWVAAGDRRADARIRKLVCAAGGNSGTVSHVNSLRGACLVQGVLAAREAAELWPSAVVTEAHPKALLRLSLSAREFLAAHLLEAPSEHERDAALASYAAWAAASSFSGWRDLVRDEEAPFFPGGHKVSYWFPVEEHNPLMQPTGQKRPAAD